jgi:hypothetical protein
LTVTTATGGRAGEEILDWFFGRIAEHREP